MLAAVPPPKLLPGIIVSGAVRMNRNFTLITLAALFVISLTRGASAQQVAPAPRVAGVPVSGMKFPPMSIHARPDFLKRSASSQRPALSARSSAAPSLDTVPLFSRSFISHGFEWPYTMIGGDPARGRTTNVPTKIVFVSLELQNDDLVTTTLVPIEPFERKILNSPSFRRADYASGENLQFGDAVQRAEFFNTMKSGWHTELHPVETVERITIQVPRTVTIDVNGTPTEVNTYTLGSAADGSPVVELLDLFFDDAFTQTVIDAINNGAFTTDSINLVVMPNTYLFSQDLGTSFLTLGFHTFFFDDTVTPTPVWLTGFASWISPGFFTGVDIADVSTLTHEISETLNDPLVDNAVPAWEFPGIPGGCQDNLETGDPLELFARQTVPIEIEGHGERFVYHPQTEALLQWFEQKPKSDAIHGAFSFPDMRALRGPATFFGQLSCNP